MSRRRTRRTITHRPGLTPRLILAWADRHFTDTHDWPKVFSGPVRANLNGSWRNIDNALRYGLRSLPGGSSLPQFLAEHRGARNKQDLPPLDTEQILAWADAHCRRTGRWPTVESGSVRGARGEVWGNIDAVLREGLRGLPGGSSLAKLLEEGRGVRNRLNKPQLTEELILTWADAHHRCTGAWPSCDSGPIPGVPATSWKDVDFALEKGYRGLPGGSSLPRLLARERGVRNRGELARLTVKQILAWADAHHERTGKWPTCESGPVLDVPGENWRAINLALYNGSRRLPGGSSLAKLLGKHRGIVRGKPVVK